MQTQNVSNIEECANILLGAITLKNHKRETHHLRKDAFSRKKIKGIRIGSLSYIERRPKSGLTATVRGVSTDFPVVDSSDE